MTSGQITYHLRRLRLHGLIERTPHTYRYKTTDFGLRAALVLTRIHNRFLTTVMADTGPRQPHPSPLGRALDNVATEIDRLAETLRIAA
jgi:predicted MarR family transcription regulator